MSDRHDDPSAVAHTVVGPTRLAAESQTIAGRFRIVGVAGSGGMGSVFRATDLERGETVALKLMATLRRGDQQRFEREARLLKELEHPGIVRYVAHGVTESGDPYLAMEWLEGFDLSERLCDGPLRLDDALALGHAVSEALAAAHQRGIVHRDIKPGNIFLVDRDAARPRLIDFGIARSSWADAPLTGTGVPIGSPGYMAPEQVRGDRDVDGRADLFSLGCVLFECLTGRRAFRGDHPMAILMKILVEAAPRITEVDPTLPDALADLVALLLERDGERRASSASEVRLALERITNGDGREGLSDASVPALTNVEQRIVTIVLASVTEGRPGVGVPRPSNTTRREWIERIRQTYSSYAPRFEALADGSLVALMDSSGDATEQAIRAARLAQTIQGQTGHGQLVVATGRSVVGGPAPIGEVVDRAVAMTTQAQPGTFCVDETTMRLLESRFDFVAGEGVYYLGAERDSIAPRRALLGRVPRFFGRERELMLLRATLDSAFGDPAARAVLMIADAGVGKSRLLQELLGVGAASGKSTVILSARGDTLAQGSAFGLIRSAFRRYAGISDADSHEDRREKLRLRVARYLPEELHGRALSFLSEGAEQAGDSEPDVVLELARRDPHVMREHVRAVWLQWIQRVTDEHSLLFVLEDVHWADPPSLDLVDVALEHVAERPLFVVATARPPFRERFPRIWRDRDLTEFRLPPLPRRAAEQWVRESLERSISDDVVAQLVEQSGGNAFFLEELIRIAATGAAGTLPDTVIATVQSRIASFSAGSRAVLRAASIFGRPFRPSQIAHLLGAGADAATTELELGALVKGEVLVRGYDARMQVEFSFRHDLLRHALYATLTDGDRRLGHRLAAELLAQANDADAAVLAEHFAEGEVFDQAVPYYLRAINGALLGSDMESALRMIERALACEPDGDQRAELYRLRSDAQEWMNSAALAVESANLALESARRGSSSWFLAYSNLGMITSSYPGYAPIDLEIVAAAEPLDESARAAKVVAIARNLLMLYWSGRYAAGERMFATIDADYRTLAYERFPTAHLRVRLARALRAIQQSRLWDALEELQLLYRQLVELGDTRSSGALPITIGFVYRLLGAYDESEASLQQALDDAERRGLHLFRFWAMNNLAAVRMRRGDLVRARELKEAALWRFERIGNLRMLGTARVGAAELELCDERFEAALEQSERAAAELEAFPPIAAWACGVGARAALRLADTERAARYASIAWELLERLGTVEEGEMTIRLARVEWLLEMGDRAEAIRVACESSEIIRRRAAALPHPSVREGYLEAISEHRELQRLAASR